MQTPLLSPHVLIAGGGIGGLSAGIACAQKGLTVRLYERSTPVGDVGAGIQLGPNVTRILDAWGVLPRLAQQACEPERLVARAIASGRVLGEVPLRGRAREKYGAPYVTVHRGDLHAALFSQLGALADSADVFVHAGTAVTGLVQASTDDVGLQLDNGQIVQGDAVVGADGLWSAVRGLAWNDGSPTATGHVAYRASVAMGDLPKALRAMDVTVWLGPRAHVVHYPIRGGQTMNIVVIAEGVPVVDRESWENRVRSQTVHEALGTCCAALSELMTAVPMASASGDSGWRAWQLFDRAPVQSGDALVRDRVVLLGDAAHPMRPYLAQGAAMAIEDAQGLSYALAGDVSGVTQRLTNYADTRWQRCARVQATARRNGDVFHASGLTRLGRDAAMWAMGRRLMDPAWLYGYAM